MKKVFILLAVFALAIYPSCTKQQEEDIEIVPEREEPGKEDTEEGAGEGITEFSASLPETKTSLGTPDGVPGSRTWPNLWSEGDAIKVNDVSSTSINIGAGGRGNSYATFTMASAVSGPYYAAYPASAVSGYSNGSATITIPATQTYTEDSYDPDAYIMIGKSNTPRLDFCPMMGLIQLTTTAPAGGGLYIKSISVEPVGGEKMSGAFSTTEEYRGITPSGSATNTITINAPNNTTFRTVFTFAVPAQNYASGIRFRITAVPNSDGTGVEQTMVFAKQSAFDVAAGTLYPLTAPAFKESTVGAPTVTTINSSTLGLSWTGANAGNNQKKTWKIHVYSDSDCKTEVRTITIPANAACWTSGMTSTVNFAIGGLTENKPYYFKVEDVQSGIISAAGSGTTDNFARQAMTSIGTSTTGTVFAEDFSELCGFGVKYNGMEFGGCYNNTANKRLDASDWASVSFVAPESGEWQMYNNGLDAAAAVPGTRFAGWLGQGNAIAKCGYLKLGGESKSGYALTPAFSVASGYMARVTVTVNAAKYAEGTIAHSIAVVHTAGAGTNERESDFTWVDTPDPAQYDGSVNASGTTWEDIVVSNLYIRNGDRIEFGSAKGSGTSNQRILMNSIKVSVDEVVPEADYLISCYETLKAFMDAVGTSDSGAKTVKGMVTHNIMLTDAQKSSIASSYPLAGYTGTLYGQNHTITGLEKPFFADLQGDVEYLTLNSAIDADTDTFDEGPAIFAEKLKGGGSLDHCTSQGSVTFCPPDPVINGTRYAAGLVAYVTDGTVTHCSNEADVSFPDNGKTNNMNVAVGGVVAKIDHISGLCSNLSNSGSVSVGIKASTSTNPAYWMSVGGVVGELCKKDGDTGSNLTNNGTVALSGSATSEVCLGGVIGYNDRNATGCHNYKQVSYSGYSGNNLYIGGVIGENATVDKTLSNSSNSGKVLINSSIQIGQDIYIGGVAGRTRGTITATNSGEVTINRVGSKALNLGGVVGQSYGGGVGSGTENTATGVISVSNLTGTNVTRIGGIVGVCWTSGDIRATNSGNISINPSCSASNNVYIGGIVGESTRPIKYSTNNGTVTNNMPMTDEDFSLNVGGVAGRNSGGASMNNNHNTNDITNNADSDGGIRVGGISAENNGYITGSDNTGDISNAGDSGSGKDIFVGGVAGISIGQSYATYIRTSSNGTSTSAGGTVSNSGAGANIFVGGVAGSCTNNGGARDFTSCFNKGPVSNTGDTSDTSTGIIAVGGITGYAETTTLKACINHTSVTNSGDAGSTDTYSRTGGIIGWAVGVDLSAEGDDKSINYGNVKDDSNSANSAFGGVVGYANEAVSDFSNCRNEGSVTIGGNKSFIFTGGIAGVFDNNSIIDATYNEGNITASGATMAQNGYLRLGGIIGGWTNDACSSTTQDITGCFNEGSITLQPDSFGSSGSGDLQDSYVGGIAGGGNNNGVCGKVLQNCKNSGAITMGSTGNANSGKLYHRFCVGGIVGFTDVNPTGSKCIANIRFRSNGNNNGAVGGNNRIGGIAGEMMISSIHDVTYKGDVNSNGTSTASGYPYKANYTGGLVGNVGTGEKTFNRCTVSGTFYGPGSEPLGAGIFFSCAGGGTGPTVNIESCTVGSGTRIRTANSPASYAVTITSPGQITAANVCGTNGNKRTCTEGTNDEKSIVVDPSTITL